jgi:selenocysteine-specific elongation factor
VDVELSLLKTAKPLKDRARVHFHSYTSETIATVALYDKKQLAPGETAYAQLRLSQPMLLLPGGRFIVRQFSPVVTIGGGVVLENASPAKVKKTTRLDFLKQLATGFRSAVLEARIAASGDEGLSMAAAVARTGWPAQQITATVSAIPGVVRAGATFVTKSALENVRGGILSTLDAFHKRNPLVEGMSKEELRGHSGTASADVFAHAFEELLQTRKIELAGELVRLAGRGVVMKDEEAESKKVIEAAFASAGLKVPALKDVLAGLKVDKARAQKIVTLLLRDKVLIKISEDLVFHRDALADLRRLLAAEKTKMPKIDVGRFKDLAGVTRKYAIPLLEYLDREHVTRRVGDARIIL